VTDEKAKMLDRTVPVPVPKSSGDAPTDESDAPTFIVDAEHRPDRDREGSVVRPPVKPDAQPSFDDEVSQKHMPGRPARPVATGLPRAPTPRPASPARPPTLSPAPSDVFTSQRPGEPAPRPSSPRPDVVGTKPLEKRIHISSDERAEPDEPTRARDPDPPTQSAPVGDPADHEHIITKPQPMTPSKVVINPLLNPLGPTLPEMPAADIEPPASPDGISDGNSGGIEIPTPQETRAPRDTLLVDEDPVDHTPVYPRRAVPDRFRPEDRERLANDDTRLKATPAEPRGGAPVGLIAGGIVGALVVAVAIVAVVELRKNDEPPKVEQRKLEKLVPSTVAPSTVAPSTVAPSTVAPSTPPSTVDPSTVAASTVAPSTVAPSPVAPRTPSPYVPPVFVRAKDGFGPFVDKSGAGIVGVGPALGRGVRAVLGAAPFGDSLVGVRGDVRRVEIARKDKQLTATVDCALVVTSGTSARTTMGASARVVDAGGEAKDRLARSAAEACAKSLEADLRDAVARARGN
jgi:hypothetical protein